MKIFESQSFRFYHEARSPDRLLLTYSPAVGPNAGQQFWGQSFCEKIGLSALGLVANDRTWYPAAQMAPIVEKGREVTADYPHVACYGGSMGGYGALKWGRAIGATIAISFSPQVSIDPADTAAYDMRFAEHFRPALNQAMALRREDLPERSYVFYDPYHPEDKAHALAIAALADTPGEGQGPHVHLIPMPSTGHQTIRVFASTERAQRMLDMCFADDVAGLRRYASELRRPHPQRMHTLSLRLLPRRVSAALTAHRAIAPGLPNGQVFREFVGALDDAGHTEAALTVARELAAKHRADSDLMIYFLRRLRRAGLAEEAAAYEEGMSEKQVRTPDLAVLLADITARAGQPERARIWAEHARSLTERRPAATVRVSRQLATAFGNAGYPDDAVGWVRSALALAPDDETLNAQLLRLLMRDKRLEEVGGLEAARAPAGVATTDLAMALAEAAMRLGRGGRAADWAERARHLAEGAKMPEADRLRMEQRLSKLRLPA